MVSTPPERLHGTVAAWFREDGWGKIRSPRLDGDVFVHFAEITDRTGYRELTPGEEVTFAWDDLPQDGCRFRAFDVRGEGRGAVPKSPSDGAPSSAYRSSLKIRWDDGSETTVEGRADDGQPPPEA